MPTPSVSTNICQPINTRGSETEAVKTSSFEYKLMSGPSILYYKVNVIYINEKIWKSVTFFAVDSV